MQLELRECPGPEGSEPCGWAFLAHGDFYSGGRCDECSGHKRDWHPRVCKVGGRATDRATLLKLARFTFEQFEIVETGFNAALEEEAAVTEDE